MHLRAHGKIPQLVRQRLIINLIELRLLARISRCASSAHKQIYYKIVYVC